MKELCLIVNPISGGKDKSGILAAVEKHLDGSLYEHRLLFTERAGQAEEMARRYGCRFVDNETPYERVSKGHPTIVNYFYHEEITKSAKKKTEK